MWRFRRSSGRGEDRQVEVAVRWRRRSLSGGRRGGSGGAAAFTVFPPCRRHFLLPSRLDRKRIGSS